MKVIGTATASYDPEYIVTLRHSELEKFLGLYYTREKFQHLKVGDTVDLGRGYDYTQQIANAMRTTQEFVKANQAIVTAILNGLNYQRIAEDAVEAGPRAEVAP